MPEIKHNFTAGKMNKDLDERIVPNGEYRDAMNIEVSTSEGSDVGTVQNVLGNSIVDSLDYVTSDTVCVGSISDEKNDKLYWFTVGSVNPIDLANGDFSSNETNSYTGDYLANPNPWSTATNVVDDKWVLVRDGAPHDDHGMQIQAPGRLVRDNLNFLTTFGGVLAYDPSSPNQFNSSARQTVEIVQGVEYTISYKRKWFAGTSGTNIYINGHQNDPSDPSTQFAVSNETSGTAVTVTDTFVAGYTGTMQFRVYFMANMTGWIDDVTISSSQSVSRIFEYDKNEDLVTPVLVDLDNSVLKLNKDNLITGINIIDDMLFWTDNHSEPKKINIPRCISGTVDGVTHTEFINLKADTSEPIKEEHITVIKKQPQLPPKIKLISERDPNLNYSGIMRITEAPTPMTVPRASVNGGNNNITNDQNNSSMWIDGVSWTNHHYDFSGLSVGDDFDTFIETDINGESGFTLQWAPGDILLFQAFGGSAYNEAPSVPLTEYSVKAKILDSSVNVFTDQPTEILVNGDFDIPNGSGNFPYGWGASSGWSNIMTYDTSGGDGVLHIDSPTNGGYNKIFYRSYGNKNAITFVEGAQYKLTFDITNYMSGAISCQAVVPDYVFHGGPNSNYYTSGQNPGADPYHIWRFSATQGQSFFNANGTYSQTFTLIRANSEDSSPYANWAAYRNKVMLQTSNGQGFNGTISNISLEQTDVTNAAIRCKVLGFDETPPVVPTGLTEIKFVVDKLDTEEKIFEFKFPRIAYRYRYQDGEYSCISPFSQVAFLPGAFDYHPKKGYNIGMSNRVKEISVSNFMQNIPAGVNEIDIIYKEDLSPNIYVVDTIKPGQIALSGNSSNYWDEEEYIIKSEQISRAIESNQLLRPWDNVPKKALAQEITGNRIVYGNYIQGYDLFVNETEDYYPDFDFEFENNDMQSTTLPSIKSLREYQVGVVFVDEYGRETPVVSNVSGAKKLGKINAHKQNNIKIGFHDAFAPDNLKYFKFFIKETSGQYYNMAMDRHYDAEDGQIWLSFPSSDRSKIEIDDFIILKKALESNNVVVEEAKYKVLDIQNEAPDFIKKDLIKIDEISHLEGDASREIFTTDTSEIPVSGVESFKVKYEPFSEGSSRNFGDLGADIWVDFQNSVIGKTSPLFKISSVHHNFDPAGSVQMADARYTFRLKKAFTEDINFITDDPSGANPSKVEDGTVLRVYKSPSQNLAKFDGKFFVKIDIDPTISSNVLTTSQTSADPTYRTTKSRKLYLMRPNHNTLHKSEIMFGDNPLGVYGGGSSEGFGRLAPFFRNYRFLNTSVGFRNFEDDTNINIGKYKFGSNHNWIKELAWVTTTGADAASTESNDGRSLGASVLNSVYDGGVYRGNPTSNNTLGLNSGTSFPGGTSATDANPKIADDNGWGIGETRFNNTVWFIDKGPYSGIRTASAQHTYGWHWDWTRATDGTMEGFSTSNDSANRFMWLSTNVHHPDFANSIYNFWNVGDPAHAIHGDQTTFDFVRKLTPGEKFRFKEDPTYEVYTVVKLEGLRGRLRYSVDPATGSQLTNGSAYPQKAEFKRYYKEDGDRITNTTSAAYTDDDGDYSNATLALSPQTTTTFVTKIVNSSGETDISWDPTGAIGKIDTGLELTLNHSGTAATTWGSDNDVYVEVDSLAATNHDGTTRNIEVGMILISHSGESNAADILDGDLGDTDPPLLVWKIAETNNSTWKIHLCGYVQPLVTNAFATSNSEYTEHNILGSSPNYPTANTALKFAQPAMNGYSQYSCNRMNALLKDKNFTGTGVFDEDDGVDNGIPRIMPVSYTLEFVEEVDKEIGMPDNPAIWETQPKENTPLDIYYEASGYNPTHLNDETINLVLPINSVVTHPSNPISIAEGTILQAHGYDGDPTLIDNVAGIQGGWYIQLTPPDAAYVNNPYVGGQFITLGDYIKVTRPDGSSIMVEVIGWQPPAANNAFTAKFYINENLYNSSKYILNWHNCFSFGNGVESNRVRDSFNAPFIANGVKASTTVSSLEGEQHRKYGLIYSGIYNGTSETNNLNQFIQAEKITKDINPIYGSIQKLHSRDTDLVTLCEDKVLRILANKDAVFNADGNPQLTSNLNVLGQTVPFVGEFGISKNPESFASESYRAYFTDKVRGAVMRLSKDGLTPISEHGMKDWFRDNLKHGNSIIGSYDDRKDEYNVSIKSNVYENSKTISFKENVKGWVSFKSFIPEHAINCANDYYTMNNGKLWKHHDESQDRNTFYNNFTNSSVNVLLNDGPSVIKSYQTLDYEGSQSKVTGFLSLKVLSTTHPTLTGSTSKKFFRFDPEEMNTLLGKSGWDRDIVEFNVYRNGDYVGTWDVKIWEWTSGLIPDPLYPNEEWGYARRHPNNQATNADWETGDVITLELQSKSIDYFNQTSKNGWHVSSVKTDEEEGSLHEFIEKEGKWFNYIKGVQTPINEDTDFGSFNLQGLGKVTWVNTNNKNLSFDGINASLQIGDAVFYQSLAEGIFDTVDSSGLQYAGNVVSITNELNIVKVNGNSLPARYDYVMFRKNPIVNMPGLSGYYADVKLENDSTEKAELFAISSEITESSK